MSASHGTAGAGSAPGSAGASLPEPTRRWLITVTGMLAAFTMVLTGTIVNVAVPEVMGSFGVGQDKAQFLATAYIATMTASQLLNAWFVAALGQRGAFLTVLAVFTAGGVLGAVSPDLDLIIAGRVMQGFASGVIQPLVMVTIFQVFPEHRRGTAMGIYSMGLVAALGLGPVVGGVTTDLLGWRYIFWVPLPLVAMAAVLGALCLPRGGRSARPPRFDWAGYALLATSVFCLMWAIAGGQRHGWRSDTIVGVLALGSLCGLVFALSQARAGATLMDLGLFRNPRFAAAAVVGLVYGVGNFAITYVVPVQGQLVQGHTPTTAGLLLLPAALALFALFPFTGHLADRAPPRLLIAGGLMLFAAGALMMTDTGVDTVFWHMAGWAVVARLGMGFITPPLMRTALGALDPEQLHHGSGTINFCRQLGGAFGINALVAFLELRTEHHAQSLASTQSAANAATREWLGTVVRLLREAGLPEEAGRAAALEHLGRAVEAQALAMAFQDGYRLIAAVFALALLPAWMLGRRRGR